MTLKREEIAVHFSIQCIVPYYTFIISDTYASEQICSFYVHKTFHRIGTVTFPRDTFVDTEPMAQDGALIGALASSVLDHDEFDPRSVQTSDF